MKKNNKFLLVIISIFVLLLSVTTFVSFSSNIEVQEVVVKSITPVYDSTSTIEVDNTNVVFNDKNQVVDYKVVIENTQDYDVKITDIVLTTPTEEFLKYEIKNINENDTLEANSTKELIISLETTGIKGWGRNFNDELTVNISFEKVRKTEPVDPPKEEDNKEEVEIPKEEIKQPEPPAPTIKEVLEKIEKIEPTKVTKDVIEFKEEVKVNVGDKIAVWIYSEPIFLGYFDVVENNGVKQIVGLEEALKKVDVQVGEHNIVLSTEEGETLGYVEVYVSENNQLSEESPEEGKIENPYTNTGWLIVYVTVASIAVIGIVILRNKKVNKYFILFISLSSVLSLVKAEDPINISITLNVSFKSQNVMKPSGFEYDFENEEPLSQPQDYWEYIHQIKNFYIQNEITEIDEYAYQFDVTEEGNGRVVAYLVERDEDYTCSDFDWNEEVICYDLYLQADGMIYPNEDASYYFAGMKYLDSINNLDGFDTSKVTNMSGMFGATGYNSESFILDVSNFDTSKATNMSKMFSYTGYNNVNFILDVSNFDTNNVTNMSKMFEDTGHNSTNFMLDVSNFDTSNVTDMSSMFYGTSYYSENFTLDVSNFDTSNVTDMRYMFANMGHSNPNFTLDVSNFDTSKVTDMSSMFSHTGYNSESFTLDLSNFDTSNVTNMSYMFRDTGYNSENFTLDLSNFDTSNVTNMSYMFRDTGYNSENFTLDLSNFDTSNVTDMSYMFYYTGYNSTKLNTSIRISNPNTTSYSNMFYNVATKEGSQIKVNYLSEIGALVSKMLATKSSDSNVVGNCIDDSDYILIGTEIDINGEKFNVISQTDATVTVLAQYNLGTDYQQSTTNNYVEFAVTNGWEYTPGPKEIDIQEWSTNPKTYVNAYVEYLKTELGDNSVTGDLITLKELETLGCRIPSNYAWVGSAYRLCHQSPYKSWLINNQKWWTRSALFDNVNEVWSVNFNGYLFSTEYSSKSDGIRPVITISKEALDNYLKAS